MKIVAAPPGSDKPEVVCELSDELGQFSAGEGVIRDLERTVLKALGPGAMARVFHIQLPGRLLEQCRIVHLQPGSGELIVSYLRERAWDD